MNENHMTETNDLGELSGRYLLFDVDTALYGIPLTLVLEIIQTKDITHLPGVAHYIKGIINLRGKVMPVIDVRLRFGLPERPYDDKTCIIVTEIEHIQVGLVVDSVSEVVTVENDRLSAPPNTREMSAWYIDSIAEIDGKVVLNIDFSKLFQDDINVTAI